MKPNLDSLLSQAAHAVQLDAALPEWVHLLPAGTFSGRDGRGPYRLDADAGPVLAAFASWGKPLPIDYEHQTLYAPDNGQPAPAAGWIHALDCRPDGLWGQVEWTTRAAGFIQNREYRYLSPVFDHDPAGRVMLLQMAGLTNDPNLYLTAIARRLAGHSQEHTMSGINKDEWRGRLIYQLSLPETSTDDDIAQQLQQVVNAYKGQTTSVAQMRQALNLATDAPLESVAHAVITATVPRTEYDRVAQRLQTLETASQQGEAETLIREAMTAGKLVPALEGWARAYASRDLVGFRQYLNQLPTLVSPASTSPAAPTAPSAHRLDTAAIYQARR